MNSFECAVLRDKAGILLRGDLFQALPGEPLTVREDNAFRFQRHLALRQVQIQRDDELVRPPCGRAAAARLENGTEQS